MIPEDEVLASRRLAGALLIMLTVFVTVTLAVSSYEPDRVPVTTSTTVPVTPATASAPVPAVIKDGEG